jgi:hypothetical protein
MTRLRANSRTMHPNKERPVERKEHAARINEAWQQGVEAIIKTGQRIIDAREGLAPGEYLAMVERDLHFKRAMAFKLVAIASNKILADVSHGKHLPIAWTTLYELSAVANKGLDLEAAIESGAIHPRMERKEVRALLPTPQRDDDLEEPDKEDPDDEPATNPLAAAWESASREERASFLHSLGRKVLSEALATTTPSRFRRPSHPPETVTDDFSDTLAARMRRGESVGAPDDPYETTALANGNGADRWSEK